MRLSVCCFKRLSLGVICYAVVDKTKTYFEGKDLRQGRASSREEVVLKGVEMHTGQCLSIFYVHQIFFILYFQVIQI